MLLGLKRKHRSSVYPSDIINKRINIDKLFNINNKKYNDLLKIIKKYINKEDKLIDIWARYGVFSYIANKKYWLSSIWIEYNQESVKLWNRKHNKLHQWLVKDIESFIDKNRNNHIVMDDVLEHLVYLNRDFSIISNNQKKWDFLFLRQMNYNSLGRKFFWKNWYFFQPAAHQYYFDEESINNLLQKYWYKIIEIHKENIIKASIKIPLQILIYLLSKLKNNKLKNNKKCLYLKNRFKLNRDIFTVVAKKYK